MISNKHITAAREIPFATALEKIGATWHYDNTYRPRRNLHTRLVLIENQGMHYELVITEPVFVLRRRGNRRQIGHGRGAISLVMALTGCRFPAAVQRLLAPAPAPTI